MNELIILIPIFIILAYLFNLYIDGTDSTSENTSYKSYQDENNNFDKLSNVEEFQPNNFKNYNPKNSLKSTNSNNSADDFEKLSMSEKALAEFALSNIEKNHTQNFFHLISFLNDKIGNDFEKIFGLEPDFEKDENLLVFTILKMHFIYTNAYNFLILIATKVYNTPIYKSVALSFLSSEVNRLQLQDKQDEAIELLKSLYISSFVHCLQNLTLSFQKISETILDEISNRNSSSVSQEELKSVIDTASFYSKNYHTLLVGTAACFGDAAQKEIDILRKIVE